MKSWLKGGLIGLGIGLILAVVMIILFATTSIDRNSPAMVIRMIVAFPLGLLFDLIIIVYIAFQQGYKCNK